MNSKFMSNIPKRKYNCAVCGIECEAPINIKNMTLCRQHRKEKHILDVRAGAKRQSERNKQYRLDNPIDLSPIECDENCIHWNECWELLWEGKALYCIPIDIDDNRELFNPAEQTSFRTSNIYDYFDGAIEDYHNKKVNKDKYCE